jgi:hypothetical protein
VQRLALSPTTAVVGGVALFVVAFQLWISPSNPPGFIRDEASIAYDAYAIGHTGRDVDGAVMPLYFRSFDDYKSPVFVYALAGVMRVAGPSKGVARATAAVSVLAAVLLLGLLAYRRSGSAAVGLSVFALAGTLPWLFELGRVAYDTCAEPVLLVAAFALLDRAARSGAGARSRGIPAGLALGALTYSYAGARLLAPLLAVALVVFAVDRRHRRWAAYACAAFALTLLPLLGYALRHPGALTARYEATTFITKKMSVATIVRRSLSNYVHDVNPWHWVSAGDPRPYVHTWGAGQLFAAVVLLAAAGVVEILRRRRGDAFWRFMLVALVLAPIPAALTEDRYYALRLVPLPLTLLVLTVPALEAIRTAAAGSRRGAAIAVAALLAVSAVGQLGWFVHVFEQKGGFSRESLFEVAVPPLLANAFAYDGTVWIDHDDRYAQAHAFWYAASHGIPTSHVVVLPDGGAPPPGSMVFGRLQQCDYVCTRLAEADTYWTARAS